MNIKHYISAAVLALVGLGFSACDGKDEPGYTPAAKPSDAQRVYFAQNKINKIVTVDETEVFVSVYRPEANSESALTVQILATYAQEADAQIFHVAPEVTFAENQAFAQIAVKYDANAMIPNTPYSINIAIDEANADVYGIASTELVLNYEMMTEWALLKGTTEEQDGYGTWVIGSPFSSYSFPARVFERHIPSDVNQMEYTLQVYLPALMDDDFDPSTADIEHNEDINDPNWIDTWSLSTADGGKTIDFPIQECILEDGIFYAEASLLFPNEFENESSFDPVSGVFTVNVMCFDDEGAWNPAPWYINLNGYADTNVYTLSLTDKGQVNVGNIDYAVIDFQLSNTLSFVNYTVVKLPEGSDALSEEEVEEVVSDIVYMDQNHYIIETVKESGNVTMTFPASGKYEIVAIGYNKANDGSSEGKVIETLVFDFETFDPNAGWTTITEDALFVNNIFSVLAEQDLEETLTVEVQKSDEFDGLYRIANPLADSPYVSAFGLTFDKFGSIEFEEIEEGVVCFPMSEIGVLLNGQPLGIISYSYYLLAYGVDYEDIPSELFGTFSNNKVEFPACTLEDEEGVIPNFILSLNGQLAADANMDFSLDLNEDVATPDNKPAAKGMAKLTGKALRSNMKAITFPARFKATFNAVKPAAKAGKPAIVVKNRRR